MKIRSKIPIVALILLILMLVLANLPYFVSLNAVKSISKWEINQANSVDAMLLWQIEIPCLSVSTTSPHGTVATSSQYVFFHRTCGLTNQELVALDVYTGEIAWTISSNNSYQVGYVDNIFFTIEGDSFISGISTEGNIIWRTMNFPSRSVRYVYPANEQLVVPHLNANQIISTVSGEVIEEINDDFILIMNDQYRIQLSENSIKITQLVTDNTLSLSQVPSSDYYLTHTYAQIYDNILLIYFGNSQIHAYELETGNLLWSKEGNFGSVPLLHNNRVYIYENDNTLALYSPLDGRLLGNIILNQSGNKQSQVGVALSASGNFITLAYGDAGEMLTLEVNPEDK